MNSRLEMPEAGVFWPIRLNYPESVHLNDFKVPAFLAVLLGLKLSR
jgi:hypothetical protein